MIYITEEVLVSILIKEVATYIYGLTLKFKEGMVPIKLLEYK